MLRDKSPVGGGIPDCGTSRKEDLLLLLAVPRQALLWSGSLAQSILECDA